MALRAAASRCANTRTGRWGPVVGQRSSSHREGPRKGPAAISANAFDVHNPLERGAHAPPEAAFVDFCGGSGLAGCLAARTGRTYRGTDRFESALFGGLQKGHRRLAVEQL